MHHLIYGPPYSTYEAVEKDLPINEPRRVTTMRGRSPGTVPFESEERNLGSSRLQREKKTQPSIHRNLSKFELAGDLEALAPTAPAVLHTTPACRGSKSVPTKKGGITKPKAR
jgi:hypothetical protein